MSIYCINIRFLSAVLLEQISQRQKYIHFFILISVAFALAGCGENSNDGALGAPPAEYQGLRSPALLNGQNAYSYFNAMFHYPGLLESLSSAWRCSEGEIDDISNDQSNELLEYVNCVIGDHAFSGRTSTQWADAGGEIIMLNSLVITDEFGNSAILSGSVYKRRTNDCADATDVFNVVAYDTKTNVYYHLDDVAFTKDCDDTSQNTVTGRVYRSDAGYVDISTALSYENIFFEIKNSGWGSDPWQQFSPSIASGELWITGDIDSRAILSIETREVDTREYSDYPFTTLKLRVESGESEEQSLEKTFTVYQFNNGAASDLRDDDGDGMNNSWEKVFGLNPEDGSDAEEDKDNDGYSNLAEHIYLGNPTQGNILPLAFDLSVSAEVRGDSLSPGHEFYLSVIVSNLNSSYASEPATISVIKSSNVSWSSHSCTPISENEIECSLSSIRAGRGGGEGIYFVPNETGDLTFRAVVRSEGFDPDVSNNETEAGAFVHDSVVDMALKIKSDSTYDYAIIGETTSIRFTMENTGRDEAKDVVFSLSLPSNIQIDQISSTQGYCELGVEASCFLGNMSRLDYANVELLLSGKVEGSADFSATISSSSFEDEPSNNAIAFNTFVGKSFLPIQALIDSVQSDETIIVPDGRYVGSFALVDGVRLVSENGYVNTTFWLNDLSSLGERTHVEGFTFTGSSYISGNDVENVSLVNNVFSNMEDAINFSNVDGQIYNNQFIHGCSGILVETSSQMAIYNNIFSQNKEIKTLGWSHCSAVRVRNYVAGGKDISIVNNTFVENRTAISISLAKTEGLSVSMANNLFVENELALSAGAPHDEDFSPLITHNLFFSNDKNWSGLEATQIVNRVYGYPLMDGLDEGDFGLTLGSVAIDAANQELAPDTDINGNSRLFDGNSDGVSRADLGALEYDPTQN